MLVATKNVIIMGKIKRMDQVKSIIKTYLETQSIKGTARRLQISKNTVRQYLAKAKRYNPDLSAILAMSDQVLHKIIYEPVEPVCSSREVVFESLVNYWLEELPRVGVTRYLLWEEYMEDYPQGYKYSQFCERLKRVIASKDLTIPMDHPPGECMQLDYAGKTMDWVDLKTGEVHQCQVLVGVMPHSQHSFAIAMPSQKLPDFIEGINQTLLFFGKLPKVILSDNLKSFVTKANRYEPDFNALCVQLATHYHLDLKAARSGKPCDKGSVENMVKTVYTRIYAPLRNHIFHSIDEINEAISGQLIIHNQKNYQKKPGCRQDIFNKAELPVMRDLPNELFEVKYSTKAKIQKNYHVFLGEEKNYYSVPYKYVGKKSLIIYTRKTVEIYVDNQRVAIHNRLYDSGGYVYLTEKSHMPRSHQEWQESSGQNAANYISWAQTIGPCCEWAIGYILRSKVYEPQSYRSCQGVQSLARKYTAQRLEKACKRCQPAQKVNYKMLENILKSNLDQQAEQIEPTSLPPHKNVRGSEAYQ